MNYDESLNNIYAHEQLSGEEINILLEDVRAECLREFDENLVDIIFCYPNLKFLINKFLENAWSNILSYSFSELEDREESFVAKISHIKSEKKLLKKDYETLEDILLILFYRILEQLFEKNQQEFASIESFQNSLSSGTNIETTFHFVASNDLVLNKLGNNINNFLNILNKTSNKNLDSWILFQQYYNILNENHPEKIKNLSQNVELVIWYLEDLKLQTNIYKIILFLQKLENISSEKISKNFVFSQLQENWNESFELLNKIFNTKNFDTTYTLLIPVLHNTIQERFEENNFWEKFVISKNQNETNIILKSVEFLEYSSLEKKEKNQALAHLQEIEKLSTWNQNSKMIQISKNDLHKQLAYICYEYYKEILPKNEIWDIEQFIENTNLYFEDWKIVLETIDWMDMKKIPVVEKKSTKTHLAHALEEFDFPKTDKKFLA